MAALDVRRAGAGGDGRVILASLLTVCVTGPESTGKTTLARRLSGWFHGELVLEASRLYAERRAAPLTIDDVSPIAREHVALTGAAVARASARNGRLVVLDTDLVSTVVYSRYYYGSVDAWITAAARARRADLYLLCGVDVPWVPDGIRDRPADRETMHALFEAAVRETGRRVISLTGPWEERWVTAREAVQALLSQERAHSLSVDDVT